MLILIFACAFAWAEEPALTKDLKILFTSDVHCAIDQGWGYGGICAVKQSLSQDCHVLLVDNGDAVQGDPVGLLTLGGRRDPADERHRIRCGHSREPRV